MKIKVLIGLCLITHFAQAQDTLLRKNTISVYGGISTEPLGIRYSRIFLPKENRFMEFEIGGGIIPELMPVSGTTGFTFNYGKRKNYFACGLHFNCVVIDFFGTEIYYGPNLSVGLHHRLNRFDLKLRILGGLDLNQNISLFLPGFSVSLGWCF